MLKELREPAVAGMFYDKVPERLTSSLTEYFSEAEEKEITGRIYGLISPHAGYIYSGKTAAYGYKLLKNRKYETVVIVSPSHQEYFEGISIYPGSGYRTPLGDLQIDAELTEKIVAHQEYIFLSKSGHRREHALEVQLPFLQYMLKDFKIVPIVIGDQRDDIVLFLGDVLGKELAGRNVLLVASSDLSHRYPQRIAGRKDAIIENDINKFDYMQLLEDLKFNKTEACGGGPIVSVMHACRILGAKKAKVLYRNDSSEASGDISDVVGYLSAVLYD